MKKTCEEYHVTPEQVKEVIKIQETIGKGNDKTSAAVVKTSDDTERSWRDYLPFAKQLRTKGVKDGLGLESEGQAKLATDAYKEAKAEKAREAQRMSPQGKLRAP